MACSFIMVYHLKLVMSIASVCPRDCYDTCFLKVVVRGGRVVSVVGDDVNPTTGGFTCPRGAHDNVRVYVSRVLYPYVRVSPKPGRGFKRVKWSEALDYVVGRLKHVLKNYGPKAVLHLEYAGNMGLLTWYFPQRLWNALGAVGTDYSICSKSGHEAISLHYGLSYGVQPDELPNMRLIVYWGFNAVVSSPHLWRLSLEARENGAVISAVDPRRSKTAKLADIWVNPRPGTDVAIAYGISRYIIEHGYIDEDFIERWTYGYEQFREEAMRWTPDRVEVVTGVKWRLIEELADVYCRLRPSVTMIGIGLQKSLYGAESVRAISLIPALLGIHRGFFYSNSEGWYIDIPYISGEKFLKNKPPKVSQVALSRYIEEGRFKFIFIYNMNPP